MSERVALLVDGDNLGAQHASELLNEAGKVGRLDIARAYVNASTTPGWLSEAGYRLIHAGTGKNAADVLLAIEAVELAIEREIDTFVLASSDGDFCHIAHWLRERGCEVIGWGEDKAPAQFRKACSAFRLLKTEQAKPQPLEQQVKSVIQAYGVNGVGIRLAELAPKMHKLHGTLISKQPEKTWRAYLVARPKLFDLDPRGPDARVRLRSN